MKIYAPNIHNFAFQLYQASNLDVHNLDKDKSFIWESGNQIIQKVVKKGLKLIDKIDVNQTPENRRVELLKPSEVIDDNYAVDFDGQICLPTNQINIQGFAYPLRFDDSYILWLNFRRPEKENNQPTDEVDISLLRSFNPDNCLIYPEHPLFLGQTLLITAWLTGVRDKKLTQTIADECLKEVLPDNYKLPLLNHTGELFGSQIFEYGLLNQINDYQHIIVWLFADEVADENFHKCYQNLVNLFLFRTKVVKAYKNSRRIHGDLDKIYRKIEAEVNSLPATREKTTSIDDYLTNLQNKLKEFPLLALKYASLLRDWEDNKNTIQINIYNYEEELKKIQEITGTQDLSFLERFTTNNCSYLQKQIQADLGYFQHGSELLDKAINAIRGIVEIEQAKSDRSLERTIQILGIGFGGGAIVSGVIVQHIDKINFSIPFIFPYDPYNPYNAPNPFFAALFLSIIATFLFIIFGWVITKKK